MTLWEADTYISPAGWLMIRGRPTRGLTVATAFFGEPRNNWIGYHTGQDEAPALDHPTDDDLTIVPIASGGLEWVVLNGGRDANGGVGNMVQIRHDDGEASRTFRQREDGFICQVSGLLQTGDRQFRRPRASGNDRLLEAQGPALHLHRVRPGEPGLSDVDVNPLFLQVRGGIVPADPGPDFPHSPHNRREVRLHPRRHPHSEPIHLPDIGRRPAGPDDRLRGDTANIQTVAPQQMFLDERDLGAQSRRPRCRDNPTGPSPHDHQVVAGSRHGVDPIRRMHMGNQRPVMKIRRENGNGLGAGSGHRYRTTIW